MNDLPVISNGPSCGPVCGCASGSNQNLDLVGIASGKVGKLQGLSGTTHYVYPDRHVIEAAPVVSLSRDEALILQKLLRGIVVGPAGRAVLDKINAVK